MPIWENTGSSKRVWCSRVSSYKQPRQEWSNEIFDIIRSTRGRAGFERLRKNHCNPGAGALFAARRYRPGTGGPARTSGFVRSCRRARQIGHHCSRDAAGWHCAKRLLVDDFDHHIVDHAFDGDREKITRLEAVRYKGQRRPANWVGVVTYPSKRPVLARVKFFPPGRVFAFPDKGFPEVVDLCCELRGRRKSGRFQM